MANRLDIVRKKRCVAIQAGSWMITARDGKVRMDRLVPVLSPCHRKLHMLEASRDAPASAVSRYLGDPYSILHLPGRRRTNMALLLRFAKGRALPGLGDMTHEQQELQHLLVYDREAWTRLLYADVASFVALQRRLHVDICRRIEIDREALAMLHFMGIQEFRAWDQYRALAGVRPAAGSREYAAFLAGALRDVEAAQAVYKLHEGLCRPWPEPGAQTELELNLERYGRMIRALKEGRVPNIVCEGLPLHPCIAMMNEWLATNGDVRLYNRRLLDVENATENERLVRAFVLQHMHGRGGGGPR